MLLRDADRPAARRSGRRPRAPPDRDRNRLLARAGAIAARVLPGARGALEPPPRQARHRGLPARGCMPRLRLVPLRAEARRRDLIYTTLITYPQAIVLGLLQGVSELFPISSLGHS